MTRPRHPRTARHGFTLVELMVATALVVLILTILAVAFGAAADSLSRLRSTGNMATQLRTAQDRLRSDLEAQHFNPGESPGPLKLVDLRYDLLGTASGAGVTTPTEGFFRIDSGLGSTFEGQDAEVIMSTRATGQTLEFTSKLQGRTPDDLFVVPFVTPALANLTATDTPLNNGTLFASKWARIKWQLNPQPAVNGVQVFSLHRCVRVIAPANVALTNVPNANDLEQFAHLGGTTQTLRDLSNPATRTAALPGSQIGPYPPGNTFFGDDIVLTNVTSFEVKPAWDPAPGVRQARSSAPPLPAPPLANPNTVLGDSATWQFQQPNGDFPFDDLPVSGGARVFDTGNDVNTLPLRIRVTALQVKIRVYDPKTLLSRQVSFIVQP